MKMRFTAIVTLIVFLAAAGCSAVPEEHQGAAKGAGVGAATGALAGAVLAGGGSRVEGALLGGLAGALVGGAIGNYTIDKEKSADQTAQKYNYQPSEGTKVRIEDTSTTPDSVNPGDKVELKSTYAVLSPTSNAPVKVTEAYQIKHNNQLVGSPQLQISHDAGTYQSSVPLYLPKDAPKGTYNVVTTISTPNSQDSRETTFSVR